MSYRSDPSQDILGQIVTFLTALAEQFVPLKESYNLVTVLGNGNVRFEGLKQTGNRRIVVSLTLERVKENAGFAINDFEIWSPNSVVPWLPGHKFLWHYGKTATIVRDLQNQVVTYEESWNIRCARDVESLFEAYDRVAKRYGCVPVFFE